jgi:hypothetical protein
MQISRTDVAMLGRTQLVAVMAGRTESGIAVSNIAGSGLMLMMRWRGILVTGQLKE